MSCFSFSEVLASKPLSSKTFILDAGHGGVDPGTVVGNIYEKNINLEIVKTLKLKLEDLGATVYLTREGDYDLGAPKSTYRKKSDFDHRIMYINHSNADYYLSIHLNYLTDTRYSGPQVFYSNVIEENKELANHIQKYLNVNLNRDREIKKISNTIYMYSKLKIPGVLLECGFLSNANERKLLTSADYINKLSTFIANSFLDYV